MCEQTFFCIFAHYLKYDNNMQKYSASDLIKKSSRQIVFLRNKKERIATAMQRKGIEFQSKITNDVRLSNKGIVAEELRGSYSYDDVTIFFCVDLFANDCFFEVKSVFDDDGNNSLEYEEWYLKNSILQCALYKSLLMLGDNDCLFTPKFRIREGFEYKAQPVNKLNDYFLIFGDVAKYKIEVDNPMEIINFYKKKINSLCDYDTATVFDNMYKRKEFETLSNHFKYTIVE